MAERGDFDELRMLFAPPLRSLVSLEALKAAWRSEVSRFGAIAQIGTPIEEQAGAGVVVVKVPVTGEHGSFTAVVSIAESGWVVGIQVAPWSAAQPTTPWEAPDYVDAGSFAERDVTLGDGPLAVPAP